MVSKAVSESCTNSSRLWADLAASSFTLRVAFARRMSPVELRIKNESRRSEGITTANMVRRTFWPIRNLVIPTPSSDY